MLSAFGVAAETMPLPWIQPEMGGVAASPPKTGASSDRFCSTSVLAKTRSQGPFCSTITISRPGVIVYSFCELVSACTKTGISRRTVAIGPEGGLSAAKEDAAKARLVQKSTAALRGGFTCSEYAGGRVYAEPRMRRRGAGSALPPLMMAHAVRCGA